MNRQEAINIVKKNWPDSSFTSLKEALEFLVPELMNTDDEKIKEAIIKGIIHAAEEGCFCADNYSVKECVSWLEKQGETFTKKDVDDAYLKGICDAKNELEKQGEQSSAEWNIFDFRTWQYIVSDVLTKKDGIGQYLDSGECKKIAKYMQEEWSKKLSVEQMPKELLKSEDYGIDGLYAAIDILQKTLGKVEGYQSDDGILEHRCAISAVKELSKQKPAWSEEDKDVIREIKTRIAQCNGFNRKHRDEVFELLDSLRLQNRWKPSDEQIEALESIFAKHGAYNDDLLSLISDLKKLK